jgi:hypothetical protein
VVGARLESLPDVIRHEEGQPARGAVEKGCIQRQPKVMVGGHVVDGIVNEDHIESTPEPQRAHIS